MSKIKNKNRFMKMIDTLEKENIKMYDIKYFEGFCCENSKDAIMHFKIKGLKNWLWGAWITDDEEAALGYKIQVFCQYERFIDKFKPSRSYFCIDLKPWYEYYEDGHREVIIDIFELNRVINYIRKHEAMAFCYEDDILAYEGELWAIWYMFKTVTSDKWYHFKKRVAYKSLHTIAAVFSFLKCIKVIYHPDEFNQPKDHINDDWLIYYSNRIGKIIGKIMERIKKGKMLGNMWLYKNDEDMMWDAYNSIDKARLNYPLKKTIKKEDGSFEVDIDEIWTLLHQMDYDEVIQIYGDL